VNPPKCSDDDYINFVIASPRAVSPTEAAKVQGDEEQAPAHDAFTRLLHRLEPDAATLWREARSQVSLSQGILVIDDSTLDKPYAKRPNYNDFAEPKPASPYQRSSTPREDLCSNMLLWSASTGPMLKSSNVGAHVY
jgi:hypothetical protein